MYIREAKEKKEREREVASPRPLLLFLYTSSLGEMLARSLAYTGIYRVCCTPLIGHLSRIKRKGGLVRVLRSHHHQNNQHPWYSSPARARATTKPINPLFVLSLSLASCLLRALFTLQILALGILQRGQSKRATNPKAKVPLMLSTVARETFCPDLYSLIKQNYTIREPRNGRMRDCEWYLN